MQNSLLTKGYPAAADLAAHTLVKLNNNGEVSACSAHNDAVIGVCAELATEKGVIADVIHQGIAAVKLSTNITVGQFLSPNTDGTARLANSGHRVCGLALKGGVSGDIIPALINPSNY